MDTATTISIGSAIGTIGSAIIYLYTLREIRKQTVNAYTPHLIVENARFYVYAVVKGTIMMTQNWYDHPQTSEIIALETLSFRSNRFMLKIHNIGFGIAKRVSIDFSYDVDPFLNQIEALRNLVEDRLQIRISRQGEWFNFERRSDDLPYAGFGISAQNGLHQDYGFVKLVSAENDALLMDVPRLYLELVNVYIFYVSRLRQTRQIEIIFPVITLEARYLDFNNTEISTNYSLTTSLDTFGTMFYYGQFEIFEGE